MIKKQALGYIRVCFLLLQPYFLTKCYLKKNLNDYNAVKNSHLV